MHSSFRFTDTPTLINLILAMCKSKNVWSQTQAEGEMVQINRIKFTTSCFDFAKQEI